MPYLWPWNQPGKPKEKRRSPRVPVEGLQAVFWDGSSNTAHPVMEMSFDGAMIKSDIEWMEGTLIRLSMRKTPLDGQAESQDIYSELWCRVVRRISTGIAVEFLFFSHPARQSFLEFLERNEVRPSGQPVKGRKSIWDRLGAT